MSLLNDWFKTKYKIVPVYNTQNKICGYTVVSKNIVSWIPLSMYQMQEDTSVTPTDNIFPTYKDAIIFLKHEITILTDEEISNTKDN